MMKKLVIVILIACLSVSLFALSGNVKQRAMSLIGIADCSNDANNFFNPASIYVYNQASKFAFSTSFFTNPDVYFSTEFINKRISLLIDIALKNSEENILRDVNLEFNAAVGYKNLGFGIGFYGGSTMYQQKTKNAVAYALFGKYKRVEESEFLNVKAGAVYKLNDFTFGITADKILTYSGIDKQLTAKNAINNISFGAYWAQQKYAKRGRLNNWVFNTGIEATNVFSNEDRAVRAGLDATLQLNKDYSISLRGGAKYFLIDNGPLIVSAGVGTRLDIVDIGACILLPVLNVNSPASFEISVSVIN